jgi:hypothetical protein
MKKEKKEGLRKKKGRMEIRGKNVFKKSKKKIKKIQIDK